MYSYEKGAELVEISERTKADAETLVVSVTGDLDHTNLGELKRFHWDTLPEAFSNIELYILVDSIDEIAAGGIIGVLKRIQKPGVQFTLVVSEAVCRTFRKLSLRTELSMQCTCACY